MTCVSHVAECERTAGGYLTSQFLAHPPYCTPPDSDLAPSEPWFSTPSPPPLPYHTLPLPGSELTSLRTAGCDTLMTPSSSSAGGGGCEGGTRREMCTGCSRPIDDRFLLRLMDTSWHEQCVRCTVCHQSLTHSCFVRDQRIFCRHDYDRLFGTRCAGCLQTIPTNELVMRVMHSVYHVTCFACVVCGQRLHKGDEFVLRDGQVICRLDWEKECAYTGLSPHSAEWGACHPLYNSDEDSCMDDNDLEGPKGPKRPRTILTTSQRRKFKTSFEVNPKPCRKVREQLAAETGLSVRVVQVWFQNQRAKVKKIQRRQQQEQPDKKSGSQTASASGGNSGSGTAAAARNRRKKEDDETDTSTSADTNPTSADKKTDDHSTHLSPDFGSSNPQDGFVSSGSGLTFDNSNESPDRPATNHTSTANPIDKLYSMQSLYFSTTT